MLRGPASYAFFFFNDTATTEIYTLSLHDALPISDCERGPLLAPFTFVLGDPGSNGDRADTGHTGRVQPTRPRHKDRKSTRLNSSHANISYAVFCLKKKTKYSYSCISLTQLNTTYL